MGVLWDQELNLKTGFVAAGEFILARLQQCMDNVRVRHALRTGLGGCIIALLSQTRITTGCISTVLFYISTIAGAPDFYQGFVLRSTMFTVLASMVSLACFLSILYAASFNNLNAFFISIPVIVFLAALRVNRRIHPFPLVVIVFTGFFLVSADGDRAAAKETALNVVYDALVALVVTLMTQLPFPDLAHAQARRIISGEIRGTGHALSNAASRLFYVVDETIDETDGVSVSRSISCAEWEGMLPPGRSRLSNYVALARAEQLLQVAPYEVGCLGPGGWQLWNRPNDLHAWSAILSSTRELVDKVSSIESALTVLDRQGVHRYLSREYMFAIFGKDNVHLWASHFAACAAACAVASAQVQTRAVSGLPPLNTEVDMRSDSVLQRRSAMYQGFLTSYKSYWTKRRALQAAGLDGKRFEQHDADGPSEADIAEGPAVVHGSELRSIMFVAVTSHAVSEVLSRVQAAVKSSKTMSFRILEPFRLFWSPFPRLVQAIGLVCTLRLDGQERVTSNGTASRGWEYKFVATHSLMLLAILAVSILVHPLKKFDPGQVAWVYASAGLAAQLSVESTLFIAVLRVCATVVGSFSGFAVNRAILAINSPVMYYALGPYFFAITVVFLLFVPPKYRYAVFLVIVTNGLVTFCPRGRNECVFNPSVVSASCMPDWEYAVTRCVNVSIGVVIACLFHFVLWPRFAQGEVRRLLSQAFGNATRSFATFHRQYFEFGHDGGRSGGNLGAASEPPVESRGNATDSGVPSGSKLSSDALNLQDVIGKGIPLSHSVDAPLSLALLVMTADTGQWTSGVLALPNVLRDLREHFVTLTVALGEMSTMLARRPVYAKFYGRTAHTLFIAPLMYEHETLLVSLYNLGNLVQNSLHGTCCSQRDMGCAIKHLKQTLGRVNRRIYELRWAVHSGNVLNIGIQENTVGSICAPSNTDGSICKKSVSMSSIPAPSSMTQASGIETDSREGHAPTPQVEALDADDAVLFNAFSFSSNSCVAAFLAIANICEENIVCLGGVTGEEKAS